MRFSPVRYRAAPGQRTACGIVCLFQAAKRRIPRFILIRLWPRRASKQAPGAEQAPRVWHFETDEGEWSNETNAAQFTGMVSAWCVQKLRGTSDFRLLKRGVNYRRCVRSSWPPGQFGDMGRLDSDSCAPAAPAQQEFLARRPTVRAVTSAGLVMPLQGLSPRPTARCGPEGPQPVACSSAAAW